jgi:tRNA(fMet)-specific endonuclease VapC
VILCDTNILIEFYKNNAAIVQELRAIGSEAVAVSVITQAELYFGALNKPELFRIRRHLALVRRYPLDTAVSERFIELMESYSLSHGLAIPDALIAATALVHSLELFTLNTRDFRFIDQQFPLTL